ncbi:helix-turn-helix domain-containing protein [Macrococcus sp. DPC7161]|uniref:helix-turn-helix domain-containing protein n=1 Tax=Macrococcus sp. DPC7161 TaxID=2507060 RepID=UPI00100B0F1D|nr:helix-turn-helix domain-containing protein [Macrococcus sp. DPC7161]RXK19295.1 hypothetical protein ER639_02960 [Macrococcus sp. DPC7161]
MLFQHQILSKKFHDKTEKSIYHILIGHKTHQTYFDAVIQDLLPFFAICRDSNLEYEAFLKQFQIDKDSPSRMPKYPYFYEASEQTFITVQLLVQSLSHLSYHQKQFIPLTNQFVIQKQVKSMLHEMKQRHAKDFIQIFSKDLLKLLNDIEDLCGHCYLMYNLSGFQNKMISEFELSQMLDVSITAINEMLLIEKNTMTYCLNNKTYQFLNACYYRAPLHINTNKTYQLLLKGESLEGIAQQLNVRIHTVQDHVLEILIKDYPLATKQLITNDEIKLIKPLYGQFGKLKSYYDQTDLKDYFKIKLAIILLSRGKVDGLE